MAFKVISGITPKQVTQLIKLSKTDSQIKKFTSDPVRFKNKEAFEKWIKGDRLIYTLVDKKGTLCGVIWFGKKKLPVGKFVKDIKEKVFGITFAIRTYGEIRGKGYAIQFMNKTFRFFTSSQFFKLAKIKGIWLETSYDNIPAIKIYKKFGFVKVTNPDKEGKILMVLQGR